MEYVMGLVTNKVLLSAVAAWFVAQGSKIILDVMKGTFTFKRLSGGGGMPSAHSATVVGLTTATAIVYGTGGFEFPMALFFAIIVMYDAVGVRLETGREAKALGCAAETCRNTSSRLWNRNWKKKSGILCRKLSPVFWSASLSQS